MNVLIILTGYVHFQLLVIFEIKNLQISFCYIVFNQISFCISSVYMEGWHRGNDAHKTLCTSLNAWKRHTQKTHKCLIVKFIL